MKAFADTLRLTTDRFQGGAAPQSDVAQARTQLETTQVQATDVAVQRAPLEHAIATLTTSDAARASYDATVAAYRQTTLSAFQQVEDNLAALRILAQKTGQQRNAVESAQQSLHQSLPGRRGHLSSSAHCSNRGAGQPAQRDRHSPPSGGRQRAAGESAGRRLGGTCS